jgi:hypothetical protein
MFPNDVLNRLQQHSSNKTLSQSLNKRPVTLNINVATAGLSLKSALLILTALDSR